MFAIAKSLCERVTFFFPQSPAPYIMEVVWEMMILTCGQEQQVKDC